ncbi:methyltransferase domain-containing protein [Actinomadura viridis]|uniref:methyltransferase domain-containing protein n=1 Tax=Actinomadura viridis TaxID=58110 RepID=UPI0036A72E55
MTVPNDAELAEQIDALCDLLAEQGDLTDPVWRRALHAVPRHLFVPERTWASPDSNAPDHRLDRGKDPASWWRTVYSDSAIITQVADGAVPAETGAGLYTSSCSAPGTVMNFMHALKPQEHDRVLEVGTGTGWTAGLLSHRVGDAGVTSLEIDTKLSEQAAKNLSTAGFSPRLIVGDGAAGWPDGAPYDRLHASCAVRSIPFAWIQQMRRGGVIVCPWAPAYGSGQLARLAVVGDGLAVGTFPQFANYMMMRQQRIPDSSVSEFIAGSEDKVARSTTDLDPRNVVWDAYAADLVIGAMLPGVELHLVRAGDGSGEWTLWLLEKGTPGGSWASVDYVPGASRYDVEQYGPRGLWDAAEDAYLRWLSWGRPGRDRFGLTVTSEGEHLWLDRPDNVISA